MTDTEVRGVVVLGGMYNPPMPVHRKMLSDGMEAVGAEMGIFAMTPYDRVFQSLSRYMTHAQVLPDAVRRKQLEELCGGDARFSVMTLCATQRENEKCIENIQARYPNAQIYIMICCRTLRTLQSWMPDELYEKYIWLVSADKSEAPEEIIEKRPALRKHKDRFRIVYSDLPKRKKEQYSPIHIDDGGDGYTSVDFENDSYAVLSNYYEAPIVWEGLQYRNVEAAFQAQKMLDPEERKRFQKISGLKARSRGLHCMPRPNWENMRINVMLELVRAKFEQNPELIPYLLETGDTAILALNRWNDTFWGVSTRTGKGANHLGEILMKVRQELREKDREAH